MSGEPDDVEVGDLVEADVRVGGVTRRVQRRVSMIHHHEDRIYVWDPRLDRDVPAENVEKVADG